MFEHSDRSASDQQFHYGSSSHICYMLYVDLLVIGPKDPFLSKNFCKTTLSDVIAASSLLLGSSLSYVLHVVCPFWCTRNNDSLS